MASYLDELVSYGRAFKVLDAETAARSVVVNNIPEEAREQDIIIHFQKRKHGGGDIERLHIIEDTATAVVTFDSGENARSVLEKPQRLKDSLLELKPYPSLPEKMPQVFCRVTARIEPDACGVSPQVLRKLLERVEEEMSNVKHHEASHCFIVSGTFEEIRQYRELLQTFLAREGPLRLDENIRPSNNSERSETENTNESLEVVSKFMKLLQRAYKERLDAIESRCLVELAWHEGSSKVEIKRRPGCSDSQYKDGVDKFINLYQQLYPEMAQEVVELHVKDDVCIEEAANQIMEKLPVFIERSNDKWSVYGEKSIIPRAVRRLKEELGLTAENGRRSRRQCNPQGNTQANKNPRPSPGSSREYSAPHGPLRHVLSNGVTITVLKGDITLQQVEAIVNAANEYLEHGGGVAGAIVRRGGFQIQEESRRIVTNRGRVPVGNAVYTSAGNLPCKVVIHAVGPRWEEHNSHNSTLLLRLACISSLRCAASLRMTSIALPAISSGIFGMPKELCAETMFEAVHEFSESVDCRLSSLRDVQFVNVDDETVLVFKKEFLNRYESSTDSSGGQHQLTTAPEDSRRDKLVSPVDTNKPLSSERSNQAGTRVSTDRPGHAERVNHPENEQKIYSKTPKADGHPTSSNDAPVNPEECSHGSTSGVEDGKKTRTGRDNSGHNEGTTHAEFGEEQEGGSRNSKGIGRGYVTVAEANYHGPAPSAIKSYELNSSSSDPRAQGGRLAATKTAETGKSGESKDNDRPNATGTNYSKPGSKHVKTAAGRGRARASAERDVKHPPGLASSKQGKRFAEQYNKSSDNQTSKSHEKLNQNPPTPKNTEVAENESRASELIGQGSSSIELTSSPGGEEDGSLTTVTTLPHNKKPLPQDNKETEGLKNQDAGHSDGEIHHPLKEVEDKDRSSEIPKPDKQQASSNDLPQSPKGFSHMGTLGGPGSSDRDFDLSKRAAHAHFGDEREGGGSNSNDIEPSDAIVPSSSGSEEDGSLLTLPNAYNTPLPEDKGADELESSGQFEEEIFPDANMDEPPPLEDENSHQMTGESKQKVADHVVVHRNDVPSSQSKSCTDETSEVPNDRWPDPLTMGTTVGCSKHKSPGSVKLTHNYIPSIIQEVKPYSEGGRETRPHGTTRCYICLGPYKDPKDLPNCGHKFCGDCIEKALQTREGCPLCAFQSKHRADADQPLGYMNWYIEKVSLPGFEDCGTIVIKYNIPDGFQGEEHANPGKPYVGVSRTVYIPDSGEGREVLKLLEQAFDARLVFTLNKRSTEEGKNLVIWNTIHHKTNRSGGPTNNGYPDTEYLSRVKQELAALGITKVT